MKDAEKPKPVIAFDWWEKNIYPRETSSRVRSLSARLRRASSAQIICEHEVFDLARDLRFGPHQNSVLVRLVTVLAEVRENDGRSLAKILGGSDRAMSEARFQRLLRADDGAAMDIIRRAIISSGRRCNVRQLAGDIIYWNEQTKTRWCFDYFGSAHPVSESSLSSEG